MKNPTGQIDTAAIERHVATTSPDKEAEARSLAEKKLAEKRTQVGNDVLRVSAAFRQPNKLRKLGSFVTAGKVVKPLPKFKDALTIVVSTNEHDLPDDRKVSVKKELRLSEEEGSTIAEFSATTSEKGQVDPETVYGGQVPLVRIYVPGDIEDMKDTVLEVSTAPDAHGKTRWEAVTDPEAPIWGELHTSLDNLAWSELRQQGCRPRYTTPSGPGTGGSSGLSPIMIGAITGGAS
ncbi:MAG TPA: hypothetical protein PKA02_02455 [Candidatus Saccharibacteria bacterium]|nr:hypothetical protein [Candidatus Saccharibacteria bacterium]